MRAAVLAVLVAGSAAFAADFEIVDTHTHFYDPTRPQGVPWPGKNDKRLYRPVLPDEFQRLSKPFGVVGTVVVEAAVRSGALSTANEAARLGRPVLGVPGPVTSGMSQGVHRLLRDGALLVTSAAEVVEALGELGADLAPRPSGPVDARDGLDPLTARVLDAVPARRPATLDSVARTAGVTPAEAAGALGLLEVAGWVRSDASGWRLAPSGAPR